MSTTKNPQHFHEFFTEKIRQFSREIKKLNFRTKNEDFEQCVFELPLKILKIFYYCQNRKKKNSLTPSNHFHEFPVKNDKSDKIPFKL